jgi:16S rRNA processing protein RimM
VKDGWIAVGRLIRPRGNRGELLAEIDSSQPGRAEKLKDVTLELNGRERTAEIEQVWHHGGRPVLKFAGIDSISEAEVWSGADVLVPESERAAPEDGEYSHADLIGCSLIGAERVGVVVGVEEYGGPPLLRVEATDGREILVPFARSICREIDVSGKIIRVELPDGLLDVQ